MRAEKEELEMMRSPDRWPAWPYLPVVNRKEHGSPECAVLFADGKSNLIMGNMFDPELGNASVRKFSSFEEIIQAGWEVD